MPGARPGARRPPGSSSRLEVAIRVPAPGILILLAAATPAAAERLPVRTWTMADGLSSEGIVSIDQDSRGFLWIGTEEGLSRFDGESFVSFGSAEGLPGPVASGVVETGDGLYWIATDAGLVRFDPAARSGPFKLLASPEGFDPRLRRIRKARDGDLLLGSWGGLLRYRPAAGGGRLVPIDLGMPSPGTPNSQVNDFHEDAEGTLWVATRYHGLLELPSGGAPRQALPVQNLRALAVDERGDFWIGSVSGLIHARRDRERGGLIVLHTYTRRDGLSGDNVYAVVAMRDGRIAAATERWVSILEAGEESPRRVTIWGAAQGLESELPNTALTEDRDGNIWIGSNRAGLTRVSPDGFTLWRGPDGLGFTVPQAILVDNQGRVNAFIMREADVMLQPFDGQRFGAIRPRALAGRTTGFWGWSQIIHQSRDGEWWVATGQGVLRFAAMPSEGLATAAPIRTYTVKDGVPYDVVFRLFEDSRGDVWISAYNVARWDRASDRIVPVPDVTTGLMAASFAEDRSGQIWIGGYAGDLYRIRNGRLERFTKTEGVPSGGIYALHVDGIGRLWIGSTDGGAARIDDPTEAVPGIRTLTMADGLSSNLVQAIAEDRFGRIYLGTGRGVDRVDPDSGRIRRFTSEDGLGSGGVTLALRDREEDLWFATPRGLSRLTPRRDPPPPAPPVMLTEVRVGGEPIPMSRTGADRLDGLVLPPERRHIEIGFVSISLRAGERPRYQYHLDPGDSGWSAASEARSVNFAHLAPGRYRFLVRAVDTSGQQSPIPASVSFLIRKPFYLEWWFLGLATLVAAGGGHLLYRQRVARLLAVERVRTRIATDLHDDIGSSLSQIAIQSQVLQRRISGAAPEERERLERIAAVSSEMVDSMSDIVWAIDPGCDRLRDLVARMRRFARDTLDAKGIALEFPDPGSGLDTIIEAGLRRGLYLLFKESLSNAARHSGCRTVTVSLTMAPGRIVLEVKDDGTGFDPAAAGDRPSSRGGRGLPGLRRRAEAMGGTLTIRSEEAGGTVVRLEAPIRGVRGAS